MNWRAPAPVEGASVAIVTVKEYDPHDAKLSDFFFFERNLDFLAKFPDLSKLKA